MQRRKKKSNLSKELRSKGAVCLVVGFILLFPLPLAGIDMRPFSAVLLVVGVVLVALPSFVAHASKFFAGTRHAQPRSSAADRPGVQPGTSKRSSWQHRSPLSFVKSPQEIIECPSGRAVNAMDIVQAAYNHSPSNQWGAHVFMDIEWRRFEAVCEVLFSKAGFTARTQSHGADGGVDIWLLSRNIDGSAAIVQCKHWRSRPVGVKELREFYGVMASNKMTRGTYATSATFTRDAVAFAKRKGINAMDGKRLLEQIASRTQDQQRALLDVAYEGQYQIPTCASCSTKMVARGQTGKSFWGCAKYPRCRTRLNNPQV